MDLHTWLLYLAASLALVLPPGPSGLLALTHGALDGHRLSIFATLGLGLVLRD